MLVIKRVWVSALSDYFDHPLTVSINSGVAKDETPRAANIRENNERKAAAVERLNSRSVGNAV